MRNLKSLETEEHWNLLSTKNWRRPASKVGNRGNLEKPQIEKDKKLENIWKKEY